MFELWVTPTLSLAMIIEQERGNSFLSALNSIAAFSRSFMGKRSYVAQVLLQELSQRPHPDSPAFRDAASDNESITAVTLRVVDWALFNARRWTGGSTSIRSDPVFPDELAFSIAKQEFIDTTEPAFPLLKVSLRRVLRTYELTDMLVERSETPYNPTRDEQTLRQLWRSLKPDVQLTSLQSKQWQEIGFQGQSPSSDFRSLGILSLDTLMYFVQENGEAAPEMVDEAVNGGENWCFSLHDTESDLKSLTLFNARYPFALAAMHMMSSVLRMARERDLQLMLLKYLQSDTSIRTSDAQQRSWPVELEPFLRIASDLLNLFHLYWRSGSYTVMQFEQVEKDFFARLVPWIRRGVIDASALEMPLYSDKTA